MEVEFTPTALDYTAWFDNRNTQPPNSIFGLDIPHFSEMGAPHKAWNNFEEMKADAVVLESAAGDERTFTYWPVVQRTTEWLWLTGKSISDAPEMYGAVTPIVLTASQIPAIMGIDPNSSRNKIWTMKKYPDREIEKSDFLQQILNWGTDHESVARAQWMKALKQMDPEECKSLRYVYECGTFQHGKYPYIGASPDGFFTELPYVSHHEALRNMTCALEIKCPWKQVLPDVVPMHHMVQMQVSHGCSETDEPETRKKFINRPCPTHLSLFPGSNGVHGCSSLSLCYLDSCFYSQLPSGIQRKLLRSRHSSSVQQLHRRRVETRQMPSYGTGSKRKDDRNYLQLLPAMRPFANRSHGLSSQNERGSHCQFITSKRVLLTPHMDAIQIESLAQRIFSKDEQPRNFNFTEANIQALVDESQHMSDQLFADRAREHDKLEYVRAHFGNLIARTLLATWRNALGLDKEALHNGMVGLLMVYRLNKVTAVIVIMFLKSSLQTIISPSTDPKFEFELDEKKLKSHLEKEFNEGIAKAPKESRERLEGKFEEHFSSEVGQEMYNVAKKYLGLMTKIYYYKV